MLWIFSLVAIFRPLKFLIVCNKLQLTWCVINVQVLLLRTCSSFRKTTSISLLCFRRSYCSDEFHYSSKRRARGPVMAAKKASGGIQCHCFNTYYELIIWNTCCSSYVNFCRFFVVFLGKNFIDFSWHAFLLWGKFILVVHWCAYYHSGAKQEEGRYKHTVDLPKTAFGMRANSAVREPEIQKLWDENQVFKRVSDRNNGVSSFLDWHWV